MNTVQQTTIILAAAITTVLVSTSAYKDSLVTNSNLESLQTTTQRASVAQDQQLSDRLLRHAFARMLTDSHSLTAVGPSTQRALSVSLDSQTPGFRELLPKKDGSRIDESSEKLLDSFSRGML